MEIKELKKIFGEYEVYSKGQLDEVEDNGYDYCDIIEDIRKTGFDLSEIEGDEYDILWFVYDYIDRDEIDEMRCQKRPSFTIDV